MTNKTALFQMMIDRYNELSFTHNYIFGFTYMGGVYATTTTSDILPYILKLDKASRGQGYSIRFKPTKEQKALLLSKGAELICSYEFFIETVKESKYNKGEIFEKLITEKFNQVWEKDSIPFTDDGDITVDGTAFQIKYESATFTNEKILARM